MGIAGGGGVVVISGVLVRSSGDDLTDSGDLPTKQLQLSAVCQL